MRGIRQGYKNKQVQICKLIKYQWFGCLVWGFFVVAVVLGVFFIWFFCKEPMHGSNLSCMNHAFCPHGTTPIFKVAELCKGLQVQDIFKHLNIDELSNFAMKSCVKTMQNSIAAQWSSLFSEQIIFICCSFYATLFIVLWLIQIVEF